MRRLAITLTAFLVVTSVVPAVADDSPRIPERARVDAFTQGLGVHVGGLRIEAIGLDEVIRQGVDLSVIDRGVAHWSGTAGPGSPGNMVLAGHRTTKTAPFRDLDLLRPGDVVEVTSVDGRTARYKVTDTLIVTPDEMWIVDPTPEPTLTMFACHPKGSARQRIVVRAALLDQPVVDFP